LPENRKTSAYCQDKEYMLAAAPLWKRVFSIIRGEEGLFRSIPWEEVGYDVLAKAFYVKSWHFG